MYTMIHFNKDSNVKIGRLYMAKKKNLWARGYTNRILENQKAKRITIEKINGIDYTRTAAQPRKV